MRNELLGLAEPPEAAGPFHRYRVLGKTVLATRDDGSLSFVPLDEYRKGGAAPADGDLRAAAERELSGSLLAWSGPGAHRLILKDKKAEMSLEALKAAIDFAFTVPGPEVRLELEGEPSWKLVWFGVQYARRKGEWHGRAVRLVLPTAAEAIPMDRLDFLNGHGVELAWLSDGAKALPRYGFAAARLTLGPTARGAEALMDKLASRGAKVVRLSPRGALPGFLRYYETALDRLIAIGTLKEERAAAFLGRRRWELPGLDVLSELGYGPDGRLYTSAEGYRLATEGSPLLDLGPVAGTRYENLGAHPAVKACLAQAVPENQPHCFHCAYKPHCSLPAAANLRAQRTLWGRVPDSPHCALHMGILDLVFARLQDPHSRAILESW